MRNLTTLLTVAVIATAFLTAENRAENFVELWQVGTDNDIQSEFGQEAGGSNAAPGNPNAKDDDYYLAGTYPGPVGQVVTNEPESDFERALLTVDPRVRVHFNLEDVFVAPDTRFRFIVDVCCSNHGGDIGPGFTTGPISFSGLFNDTEILTGTTSGTDDQHELFTSDPFTAGQVRAATGDSVITIERPASGGGNWMQFDYFRLEVDTDSITCTEPICAFYSDVPEVRAGGTATLRWIADPTATLEIDQGIGSVDASTAGGFGTIEVTPGAPSTTYTLTATRGEETATATVSIAMDPFACLWQVGVADGGAGDLVQEDNSITPPPGSATQRDDDWYFAGVYPDPVGIVADDEALTSASDVNPREGFERALLVSDPNNRIHFNLDEENASPGTDMRLIVATANSSLDEFLGFSGPIDFTASYNGNQILSSTVTGAALQLHEGVFNAGDVGATTGDNVIEISRKTDAGGAWMLFDYVKLETSPSTPEELRITSITRDHSSGDVTVTWNSRIDDTYIIQTSTDLGIATGEWGEFDDSFVAESEASSVTIPGGDFIPAGTKRFYVRVLEAP